MSASFRAERFNWRGLVLPVALLALWWFATGAGWVDTKLIVPPAGVAKVALRTMADPLFWQGVAYSIGRDVSGFAIGAVDGILLGTLVGVSRLADRITGPTFHTVRQISLFAWLPLLSSWLGYGELSKLVFISLSTLYPVALGTFEGVRSVTRAHAEVARVFRFSPGQTLRRLILPAAAPQIATGLTLGLVYAWVATIGSEFLLANWGNGLGNIVIKGRAAFNVELIVFGMLAIGRGGFLCLGCVGGGSAAVVRTAAPRPALQLACQSRKRRSTGQSKVRRDRRCCAINNPAPHAAAQSTGGMGCVRSSASAAFANVCWEHSKALLRLCAIEQPRRRADLRLAKNFMNEFKCLSPRTPISWMRRTGWPDVCNRRERRYQPILCGPSHERGSQEHA